MFVLALFFDRPGTQQNTAANFDFWGDLSGPLPGTESEAAICHRSSLWAARCNCHVLLALKIEGFNDETVRFCQIPWTFPAMETKLGDSRGFSRDLEPRIGTMVCCAGIPPTEMLTQLNQARNIRFMTVNWFGFVRVWNWCAASAMLRKPEKLGIWGWFAWTWRQINSDLGIHPVLERQKSWATLYPSTTWSVHPMFVDWIHIFNLQFLVVQFQHVVSPTLHLFTETSHFGDQWPHHWWRNSILLVAKNPPDCWTRSIFLMHTILFSLRVSPGKPASIQMFSA